MRRDPPLRLAGDGMADIAAAHVHINPNHPAEKVFANLLGTAERIVRGAFIRKRQVKKAIGPKKHPASGVQCMPILLLDEDQLRVGIGDL